MPPEGIYLRESGTGAGGVMPSGEGDSTGFTRKLGTDLSNDHPISFTYDGLEQKGLAVELALESPPPASEVDLDLALEPLLQKP